MKVLTVYFTICSVAKSDGSRTRKYKKTRMRKDFPEETHPETAIGEILDQYGERPENTDPFKIIPYAHEYAEIGDWRIHEVYNRPREAVVHYIDQDLLPPALLAACLSHKDSERPF